MSLEQAVVQLEQTNAALQEEVVRFRDSAMGFFNIYPTITAGRQTVSDGAYFSVPGNGAYMRLYRRQGSSAELIAEYPSRESMVEAINEATADAEARADAAADRAEVYADNKGFVALERFRKQATLDLDFGAGDYSIDNGDKLRTTNATDLLTVERATPKWVEGPNGKLREVPPNTIAREWRNGEPQGALIEESRTNLLLWSEDFTQSFWATQPAMIEVGVDSPDGTPSYKLEGGGTAGTDVLQSTSISVSASGARFTASYYIKQASNSTGSFTARIITSNGQTQVATSLLALGGQPSGSSLGDNTFVSANSEPVGSGWYRVSFVFDVVDTATVRWRSFTSDSSANYYLWGIQLEEGSTPSSYIPTTDSSVTRAKDIVYRTLGEEFNLSEGTVLVEFVFAGVSSFDVPLSLNSGSVDSSGTRLAIRGYASSVSVDASGWGAGSITGIATGLTPGTQVKAVLSYSKADGVIKAAANGGDVVEVGIDDPSVIFTTLIVGRQRAATGANWEPVAYVNYVPRALTEAELQELTAL